MKTNPFAVVALMMDMARSHFEHQSIVAEARREINRKRKRPSRYANDAKHRKALTATAPT